MANSHYTSWGRYPKIDQKGAQLSWRSDPLPEAIEETETLLPYGNGRSYGDVCLNRGGTVLDVRGLDNFIAFDAEAGLLRCEAGVLLSDVLKLAVPQGWFLPVSPGTRFVTVGGAVANDVHGKNHHRAGSFGCHVTAFKLLRSNGDRLFCSADKNQALFSATIGGFGLTGLITWVEMQLRPISGPMLREESFKFSRLEQFFSLSDASDQENEYTVAWIDCLATGRDLGRGLFARANHWEGPDSGARPPATGPKISLPFQPPFSLVNKLSLKAFNAVWYARQRQRRVNRVVHYQPFFYPLDAIGKWNLMYGPKGMLQYQCVLPGADGREMLRKMLTDISRSGQGSFLAVLKLFGSKSSPGLMSFPRAGVTLALDFPNRPEVFPLLERLDAMTKEVSGAVYPAKDARMSKDTFHTSFPEWERFSESVDPAFSSSFWRRVTGVGD